MNDLKQKAQDFLPFAKQGRIVDLADDAIDFAADFAQSLIDSGNFVEKVYLDFCDSERSRLAGELAEIHCKQSTVSSAGKEVPLIDIEQEAILFFNEMKELNPKGGLKEFVRLSIIRGYKLSHQFKSSPVSTEQPKDTPQLREVKSARSFIMEANEGDTFYNVIGNLTEDQILDSMEQYARQLKSNLSTPSKEISDEEIEGYIDRSLPGWRSDASWTGKAYAMRSMAKWYRKQLKAKPSFLDYVSSVELAEKDKNLVKGVYYAWLSEGGDTNG